MVFSEEEKVLIGGLSVVGGWDDPLAQPIKNKLKPYLFGRTTNCCAYCLLSMHSWHGLTIDVEHVLPKGAGLYPQFTFEPRNLSVSCKRCNMGIKRSDVSFYIGQPNEADPFRSELYRFIHPNSDVASHHLRLLWLQVDAKRLLKYTIVNDSGKGQHAYDYFHLKEIEVNTFDGAQGLTEVLPSDTLPPEVVTDLKPLLDRA